MNRRRFLQILAGTAAASIAARTYFLPPIGGWESDVIAHAHDGPSVQQIQLEALNRTIRLLIEKDSYYDDFIEQRPVPESMRSFRIRFQAKFPITTVA